MLEIWNFHNRKSQLRKHFGFPSLTTVVSKRQPDLLTAASSKLCVITTGSDSSSVGGQEGGVYGVGFLRNDKIIYGVCQ